MTKGAEIKRLKQRLARQKYALIAAYQVVDAGTKKVQETEEALRRAQGDHCIDCGYGPCLMNCGPVWKVERT